MHDVSQQVNGHIGEDLPAEDRLLLTTKDAARYLSVSPRKLWDLTRKFNIPVVRLGGKLVRYDVRDLMTFADRHKVPAVNSPADSGDSPANPPAHREGRT